MCRVTGQLMCAQICPDPYSDSDLFCNPPFGLSRAVAACPCSGNLSGIEITAGVHERLPALIPVVLEDV